MLLIGGAGRNSGKTRLSCELIRRFGGPARLVGAKVTTVHDRDGPCPRGNEDGCGVCTALEADFHITEETGEAEGKDTTLMLAAGARPVYWLRVLREHLDQGAAALRRKVGDAPCICESNSLRHVVQPGLFIIVKARSARSMKRSSRDVLDLADRLVLSDDDGYDLTLDRFCLADGAWSLDLRGEASPRPGVPGVRP